MYRYRSAGQGCTTKCCINSCCNATVRTGQGTNETVAFTCEIQDSSATAATADAIWHHLPGSGMSARRHPKQLLIGFSMESSAYYKNVDDPLINRQMDIKQTYQLDSDVVVHYFEDSFLTDLVNRPSPIVPTSQKRSAVAYLNRNCGALNGRHDIISKLSELYPVFAHGCSVSKNQAAVSGARIDKTQAFSIAKFCVAMENSNSVDYVSEKLWQAFIAGCVPIYMGAPNIVEDFLPLPNSVILYDPAKGSTPEKLAEDLKRLSSDEKAYEEMLSWRKKPLRELSQGFQRLIAETRLKPKTECQLCQVVAKKRMENEKAATSLLKGP